MCKKLNVQMWYKHIGILFSFEKEWNSDASNNMYDPRKHYVK